MLFAIREVCIGKKCARGLEYDGEKNNVIYFMGHIKRLNASLMHDLTFIRFQYVHMISSLRTRQ